MKLPYVIDNQTHVLADILRGLLTEHKGRSLDVATAYFTVGGFGLLKEGLMELGNFRLLLGAEPRSGEQIGLRPDAGVVKGLIRKDLEELPFDENTLRLVEDTKVDPIQQTVATALQSYLNHPDVERSQAIEAIRFLNQPMLRVQAQKLRQAYRDFQGRGDINLLLVSIQELRKTVSSEEPRIGSPEKTKQLKREELRLICFDLLTSG